MIGGFARIGKATAQNYLQSVGVGFGMLSDIVCTYPQKVGEALLQGFVTIFSIVAMGIESLITVLADIGKLGFGFLVSFVSVFKIALVLYVLILYTVVYWSVLLIVGAWAQCWAIVSVAFTIYIGLVRAGHLPLSEVLQDSIMLSMQVAVVTSGWFWRGFFGCVYATVGVFLGGMGA